MFKSAYLATFHGSTTCDAWKLTWKCWAPPRFRLFHWLAHLDRCCTADRLAAACSTPPLCPLCDQAPETMHHLLLACPFSRQVWYETLAWLRMPCHPPDSVTSLNAWCLSTAFHLPLSVEAFQEYTLLQDMLAEISLQSVPDKWVCIFPKGGYLPRRFYKM